MSPDSMNYESRDEENSAKIVKLRGSVPPYLEWSDGLMPRYELTETRLTEFEVKWDIEILGWYHYNSPEMRRARASTDRLFEKYGKELLKLDK